MSLYYAKDALAAANRQEGPNWRYQGHFTGHFNPSREQLRDSIRKWKQHCSGAILGSIWIITAARCVRLPRQQPAYKEELTTYNKPRPQGGHTPHKGPKFIEPTISGVKSGAFGRTYAGDGGVWYRQRKKVSDEGFDLIRPIEVMSSTSELKSSIPGAVMTIFGLYSFDKFEN